VKVKVEVKRMLISRTAKRIIITTIMRIIEVKIMTSDGSINRY